MELRDELSPRKASPEVVEKVARLVDKIGDSDLDSDEAQRLVDGFNRVTGRRYEPNDFREFWSAVSAEEFAETALAGEPPRRDDITEDEFIEMIRRVMESDCTPAEQDFWLQTLAINLCSATSDLIFWDDLETPEAVYARARELG